MEVISGEELSKSGVKVDYSAAAGLKAEAAAAAKAKVLSNAATAITDTLSGSMKVGLNQPAPANEFTLNEITVTKVNNADRSMINHEYVGRDKFEDIKTNTVKRVTEEPVSTFSIDIDTASYAFVRRALNSGYLPQADSVRIEELINYFDYDYPFPGDKSVPFKPTIAIFQTPWNANTRLLHIGIKGYDIVPEKKPKANLTFLIDVSGSMQSDDKLPLLKNSLRMLVDTLDKDDTVGIAVYAGAAGTVLERTNASEKSKILAAIDKLQAGGSTAGGEGIKLAYSMAEAGMDPKAINRVILATDGDFNVGITDKDVLQDFVERKRKTGIYLSVLGFGQGNYNDELMQRLAQNGNGNAAYIDNLNEARKVLVDEATGTLFAIAKDVKIQVEFNPDMVSEYRLIGYETRQLNREDFKNDKVDAGDIGSGHSVTAIYEITPKGSDAQLIDDLRYGSSKDSENVKTNGKSSEYAFLKIRYKLPDEDTSREISTPIDKANEYKNISEAPADSRFAAAVAAFGQLLRGESYINQFTYDDVIALASDAKKIDTFGYRTEFINLVRLAKTASAIGDR
ncbi:MAG: VWA domain-containing protein [Deltaproteobacteria bacterium]|nr:VWA domain-containing protein [Deltaproteobacteria bacterium]